MNISVSGISFQAFLFSCMAVAFPSLASAQWTMSLPPPTQTAAYFANDTISREIAQDAGRHMFAPEQFRSGSAAPKQSPLVSTRFTQSKTRTKENLQAFANKV
jgi:hypothetical protein